ncbi:MAG: hypothetical protein WAT93_03920 [Pontixanthobacter sp.]
MPLSDTKLDEMLDSLRAAQLPHALASDDGFHNNVWLRVGEMNSSRLSRQKSLLAVLMFVTALGAGFGTAEQPAMAMNQTNPLIGGADYSPASLLHVSQ